MMATMLHLWQSTRLFWGGVTVASAIFFAGYRVRESAEQQLDLPTRVTLLAIRVDSLEIQSRRQDARQVELDAKLDRAICYLEVLTGERKGSCIR